MEELENIIIEVNEEVSFRNLLNLEGQKYNKINHLTIQQKISSICLAIPSNLQYKILLGSDIEKLRLIIFNNKNTLESFNIHNCYLSGKDILTFSNVLKLCPNLKNISITEQRCSENIIDCLNKIFRQCNIINLMNNNISDQELAILIPSNKLEVLNLAQNNLYDISYLFSVNKNLTQLKNLNASSNRLDDKSMENLANEISDYEKISIEKLNLSNNRLTERSLKGLCKLIQSIPSLIELDISSNQINFFKTKTDLINEFVKALQNSNIEKLNLSDSVHVEIVLNKLFTVPNKINFLIINFCGLQDDEIKHINFKVKFLEMKYNCVSKKMLEEIYQRQKLILLNCSSNRTNQLKYFQPNMLTKYRKQETKFLLLQFFQSQNNAITDTQLVNTICDNLDFQKCDENRIHELTN